MGLSTEWCMTAPFGLLLDLIAIDQIQHGAKRKLTEEEETAQFDKFLMMD